MIIHAWGSGARLKHSDMPSLRAIRECLRNMHTQVRTWRSQEKDPAMLIAYSSVIQQLQHDFDMAGQYLKQLERQAPARSP